MDVPYAFLSNFVQVDEGDAGEASFATGAAVLTSCVQVLLIQHGAYPSWVYGCSSPQLTRPARGLSVVRLIVVRPVLRITVPVVPVVIPRRGVVSPPTVGFAATTPRVLSTPCSPCRAGCACAARPSPLSPGKRSGPTSWCSMWSCTVGIICGVRMGSDRARENGLV